MKKIALIITSFLILNIVNAQNITQGLNLSQDMVSGSARYVGMAGAFNSLGGDFSAVINNPAGLGVYRSSEFGFSFNFSKNEAESSYLGNSVFDYTRDYNIEHVGFVSVFEASDEDKSGFQYYNFGFGYNKLADYNGVSVVRAVNPTSSITDYFASSAYGLNYNLMSYEYDGDELIYDPFNDSNLPFESILAWNTYLIDTIPQTNANYDPDAFITPLFLGDQVEQERIMSTAGDKGEYNFSFATNYNDVLYIGASLGIQRLLYDEISNYNEYYVTGNISDFDALNYNRSVYISGNGVNAKFGIIYKPIKSLRLAASIHSPTFFDMTYDYSYQLKSAFIADNFFSEINGYYGYNFESPMKTNFGASYIYKNIGLISVDYEMIDYRTMRYSKGLDGDNFEDLNTLILNTYTIAHNIRVGAEGKIGPLAVRGGFASYSSPYKNKSSEISSGFLVYSGGVGFLVGPAKLDVAYSIRNSSVKDRFYSLDTTEPESFNINQTYSQLIFTLGFRF